MEAVKLMASTEGIFPCPEGAATLAGLKRMVEDGQISRDERVVLLNTGSGLKYADLFEVKTPTVNPKEKQDYNSLFENDTN